jgi:hypothetical protein
VFFLSWKNSALLIFLGFTALDLGLSALNLRPAPLLLTSLITLYTAPAIFDWLSKAGTVELEPH